jgi:hypothetical protein
VQITGKREWILQGKIDRDGGNIRLERFLGKYLQAK